MLIAHGGATLSGIVRTRRQGSETGSWGSYSLRYEYTVLYSEQGDGGVELADGGATFSGIVKTGRQESEPG